MSDKLVEQVLGQHPRNGIGPFLVNSDTLTASGVPHRELIESTAEHDAFVNYIRDLLVRHHVSPEQQERDNQRLEALKLLGHDEHQARIRRFPTNPATRKGNLAEVVLAEYLVQGARLSLPVYRLRYNTNLEQSMKGDDVLAFDLDADPVRIVVGESKFRALASRSAVAEMVEGLLRSNKAGLPVSLQFVADRLFEMGRLELGRRVQECATLFALGQLRLDYVGFLMSDRRCGEKVRRFTPLAMHRLVIVSLGLDSPDLTVDSCYDCLESLL